MEWKCKWESKRARARDRERNRKCVSKLIQRFADVITKYTFKDRYTNKLNAKDGEKRTWTFYLNDFYYIIETFVSLKKKNNIVWHMAWLGGVQRSKKSGKKKNECAKFDNCNIFKFTSVCNVQKILFHKKK